MKRLLPMLFMALTAFTNQPMTQPAEERAAQNALPQSKDPLWVTLGKTKITTDKKKGTYSAAYPPEVNALFGKETTVNGFIMPLENSPSFKHFLLSKRTPTCQFCPPGEPNEVIDITLDKPIEWKEDAVSVSGKLEKVNNAELGVFFAIKHAKAKF